MLRIRSLEGSPRERVDASAPQPPARTRDTAPGMPLGTMAGLTAPAVLLTRRIEPDGLVHRRADDAGRTWALWVVLQFALEQVLSLAWNVHASPVVQFACRIRGESLKPGGFFHKPRPSEGRPRPRRCGAEASSHQESVSDSASESPYHPVRPEAIPKAIHEITSAHVPPSPQHSPRYPRY
jgi:hypothetical protein